MPDDLRPTLQDGPEYQCVTCDTKLRHRGKWAGMPIVVDPTIPVDQGHIEVQGGIPGQCYRCKMEVRVTS